LWWRRWQKVVLLVISSFIDKNKDPKPANLSINRLQIGRYYYSFVRKRWRDRAGLVEECNNAECIPCHITLKPCGERGQPFKETKGSE